MTNVSQLVPRIISARRSILLLSFAASCVFGVGTWIMMGRAVFPASLVSLAFLIFFGGSALVTLFGWLRGVPRLEVSEHGLRYATLLRDRYWTWGELGPFALCERHSNRQWGAYACAFLDMHHDLMVMEGNSRCPTYLEADVRIPVEPFTVGNGEIAGWALVSELNDWRTHYGRPEIEIEPDKMFLARASMDRRLAINQIGLVLPMVLGALALLLLEIFVF